MDEADAFRIVGKLPVFFPGFDDDATVDAWVERMVELDSVTAADAAVEVMISTPGARFLAWSQFNSEYRAQLLIQRDRQALAQAGVIDEDLVTRCDGSGWLGMDDGTVPCSRCNPYVYRCFQNRWTWERYIGGVPIEYLDVGISREAGKLVGNEGMPVPCYSPGVKHLSYIEGVELAYHAYVQHCELVGNEPDRQRFERILRGYVR